jgi:hypothetical protein
MQRGSYYVKFLKDGIYGDRLEKLTDDGLRWRWWKIYLLSEPIVFPGLVSKRMTPFTDNELVAYLYGGREFNGMIDKLSLWRREKAVLVESGLLRSCVLAGKEYLWSTDYHYYQSKYSNTHGRIDKRYYESFLQLNERDKVLFVLLVGKFRPKSIDLSVFGLPEFERQFESFLNKKMPLFNGSSVPDGTVGHLTAKITEKVASFVDTGKAAAGGDARQFMDWYCETYKRLKNAPYSRGGKDYGLVASMLKVFSFTELKTLAGRFLTEEDAFVKKAGYTIGVFKTMVNRLVMTKERRGIGVGDFSKYEKM